MSFMPECFLQYEMESVLTVWAISACQFPGACGKKWDELYKFRVCIRNGIGAYN